jgi:carboxyl-terminal processing protease
MNPSRIRAIALLLLSVLSTNIFVAAQIEYQRARARMMLDVVAKEVAKQYYDAGLRGLDWKTLVAETRARIDKASSDGEMMAVIYSLLQKLQDSHTLFLPPRQTAQPRFGFKAKPFGDEVRVYELKKKGPAERAGLQLGDRILLVNGFRAERASFDLLEFYLRLLRPVTAFDLLITRDGLTTQKLRIEADMKSGKRLVDLTSGTDFWELVREAEDWEEENEYARYSVNDEKIGYLHLSSFNGDKDWLHGLVKKVSRAEALILDLRGNPGGDLESLAYFAGFFTPQPLTMADLVGRKGPEPLKTKPQNPNFTGPVYVLVDSQSASAAEIFARHLQRLTRAAVIGDKTSGRVTAARVFPFQLGTDEIVPYAVEVTVARVVFPGDEQLEKIGVTPDHVCIPTADHLKNQQDTCRELATSMARKALAAKQDAQGGTSAAAH